MPVLRVWEAENVIVFKRSMASGYAGVQNPLFFRDNAAMLFWGVAGGSTITATASKQGLIFAPGTVVFCMADADGDGQSNGLEMGDPCCKWSAGQTPQFTSGLSDPNSAASKTLTPMPPCIMALANAKLMCSVCIQALQLDMAKPSNDAAEFSLTSVKSCKDATQDDAQKLLCLQTLLKNADQLLIDQKNGVTPTQSCMNLGLVCMAPTAAPTKAPTGAPVAPTTGAPVAPTTAAPTTAAPTAPFPPRVAKEAQINMQAPVEPSAQDSIVLPVVLSAAGAAAIILSVAVWRHYKNKKEAILEFNQNDFQAMPDVEYASKA
jgi:hypothetical protein